MFVRSMGEELCAVVHLVVDNWRRTLYLYETPDNLIYIYAKEKVSNLTDDMAYTHS